LPSPTTEDESKNTTTPQHASTASPPSELTKTLEELYSLLLTRVPNTNPPPLVEIKRRKKKKIAVVKRRKTKKCNSNSRGLPYS
jgi:hypothetical protein